MRFVALIDGEAGAYGIVFPDCPGCTAMGKTIDEAVANAKEALSEWMAAAASEGFGVSPRPVEAVRADSDVAEALRDGAALTMIPVIRETGRPTRANLSLDTGLLAAIDEAAAAAGLTRSAFLASAARDKIRAL